MRCEAELRNEHRRLQYQWEAARAQWSDDVGRLFETMYWVPLDKQTHELLESAQRLSGLLNDAVDDAY